MTTKTLITIVACASVIGSLSAAPFKSAVISKKINEVKVSEQSKEAKDVDSGQTIGKSSTILTGRDSRAELSFPDQTITRIGANSVFRFTSGSRDMAIDKGSFLLQVPKNAGGATIRTATVTAAITGTTVMMEYSPPNWVKFICLEGEAVLTNKFGKKITIKPGEMIVMDPDAEDFPAPVIVNVQKLMKTSILTNSEIFGDLSPVAMRLIAQTIATQMNQRRDAAILPTGITVRGPDFRGGGSSGGDPRTIIISVDSGEPFFVGGGGTAPPGGGGQLPPGGGGTAPPGGGGQLPPGGSGDPFLPPP